MRLWDAESGSQTLVLRGHKGPVGAVAFSPDGTKVASVSGDGTVARLGARPRRPHQDREGRADPDLTDEECGQYLHVDRCPEG